MRDEGSAYQNWNPFENAKVMYVFILLHRINKNEKEAKLSQILLSMRRKPIACEPMRTATAVHVSHLASSFEAK